ncbi:MAG: BACON domain-containing protein, partial [Ilumatobacteraceae bacterium]
MSVWPNFGVGSAEVMVTLAPNSGPHRSGFVRIAGEDHYIEQASDCSYSIAPEVASVGIGGGSYSVAVTTSDPSCPWEALSLEDWITVSTPTGVGSGTVELTVAANAGFGRTGSVMIGGRTHTVTQGSDCEILLQPDSLAVSANGGTLSIAVLAGSGCSWSVEGLEPWMQASPPSGSGSGTVTLTVGPNNGPERSGSIWIGGEPVDIEQASNCLYAISSSERQVPTLGDQYSVTVSTVGPSCAWEASVTSGSSWIDVWPASGVGSGSVTSTVEPNPGAPRVGTVYIGGRWHDVVQASDCDYTLSSIGQSVPASGGQHQFTITTSGPTCTWEVTRAPSWATVVPIAGVGNSGNTISVSVAPNAGPMRIGYITVGGRKHNLIQGSNCTYALSAGTHTLPASGGQYTVDLTTVGPGSPGEIDPSGDDFVTFSPASGVGSATITITAGSNPGPMREVSLRIGGELHVLTQQAGTFACGFSIEPTSATVPAAGSSYPVTITANANHCAWQASGAAGASISPSPAEGAGSGSVTIIVAPNSGPARTIEVEIAGEVHVIEQEAGSESCNYSISETYREVSDLGETYAIEIGTGGASCWWSVVSSVPWVEFSAPFGSGPATIEITVQPNDGGLRSATLTIEGIEHQIVQDSAKVLAMSVQPSATAAPGEPFGQQPQVRLVDQDGAPVAREGVTIAASIASGGGALGGITIATTDAGGLAAFTDLSISGEDGARTLEFSATGAASVTSTSIGVSEGGGGGPSCSFAISSDSQAVTAAGGSHIVMVTASAEACSWSVSESADWLEVDPMSGTGSGSVTITVAANTGSERVATVTIAGAVHEVSQEEGVAPCTVTSLSPGTATFSASGGSGSTTVSTSGAPCS